MLVLFARSVASFDEKCVGAHIHPEKVNNMKPIYVQVMLRHGARTPQTAYTPVTHRGYWVCDSDEAVAPRMHGTPISDYRRFKHVLDPRLVEFLPNCRVGDLTLEGMNQHKSLGEFYHNYTFDYLKLFGENAIYPSSDQFYFRATDFERTLRSAQSFIHGFYPPYEPNQIFDIVTGNEDGSVMRPNGGFCQEMADQEALFKEDPEMINYIDTKWEELKELSDYLKVEKSFSNLNLICDWVNTHYCGDKQLPIQISDEMVQKCLGVNGHYLYGLYTRAPKIFGSYSMREILRQANESLSGNTKVKFALNSAHDSTVATIYTLLASKDGKFVKNMERIPPFASHLSMEIWEDEAGERYVRFAFNGELVELAEFDGQTLVKYNDFLKSPYMEIYDHCTKMP